MQGLQLSYQALPTRAVPGMQFLLQEDKQTMENWGETVVYAHKKAFFLLK